LAVGFQRAAGNFDSSFLFSSSGNIDSPLLLREGKDDRKVEEEKEEKPKRKGGGGDDGDGDVGKSSGGSSSGSSVIKSKYFSAAHGSALESVTQQRSFSSLELLRMYRSATYYW